ncbi:MAG: daunorubicin ABC transporter ATP-binding protein [Gemmatimonadetes bacterium]|nr:daunorubicin ABC transporter ATP-binding protein [Gemmatimonadota bacterium]
MAGDGEIVLAGAGKRFGAHTALQPTDLVVQRGEAALLAGANGAGKSTLLRLVAGLCRPSQGTVLIGGCDLQRAPETRAAIGLLSHQILLYDELTARENLLFFARLYSLNDGGARADEALAAAGLAPRQDHRVGGFSRGMKQRLALARATLHRPSVLLLDEPFTGLDAAAGTALRERLCRFRADGGTCLLVTHRFDEAEGLIDRLLVLERGRLQLDEVLSANTDAAALQARCAPFLDAAP